MNVLSLFDGMSCGMLAMRDAGIEVTQYVASEIDPHAQAVSKANFPGILRVGDVTSWWAWDVLYGVDFSEIDIVIGGSPCQGLSRIGMKRGLSDERSRLFFTYVQVLEHIKTLNPNVHFLLENVVCGKETKEIMSEMLGVQPVQVSSKNFTAQNRPRLYWTSWDSSGVRVPKESPGVSSILDAHPDEKYRVSEKSWAGSLRRKARHEAAGRGFGYSLVTPEDTHTRTILARYYKDGAECLVDDGSKTGRPRRLSPSEVERLQGVPVGFTSVVSDAHRYKMLGNGWTVPVISALLQELNEEEDLI